MEKSSNRLIELDILRACAILLILIDHVPIYLISFSSYPQIRGFLGYIGLLLFFFVSGYVITLRNQITSFATVKQFYKKRALRIYPLYWLALLTFFVAFSYLTNASLINVICQILGLQVIFATYIGPMALWFIGAILLCYLLYPLVTVFLEEKLKAFAVNLLLFGGLVALHLGTGLIFNWFFLYYPAFVIGVFISKYGIFNRLGKNGPRGLIKKRQQRISYVLIASTLLTIVGVASVILFRPLGNMLSAFLNYQIGAGHNPPVFFLMGYITLFLLFYGARRLSPRLSTRMSYGTFFLAYASYCVYLFHEQSLQFISTSLESTSRLSANTINVILIFIVIPLLFVGSFLLQRSYDRLSLKVRRKDGG